MRQILFNDCCIYWNIFIGICVTYGVFLGILVTFSHVHTCWRTASVGAHVCLCCHDVTSWYDVTWNTSDIIPWHSHDITGSGMMSWVYPIKALRWAIWGPGVHFSSEFDCLLRVLMHARIDVLTHLHFWSLLPSNVFDWVVIAVSVCMRRCP